MGNLVKSVNIFLSVFGLTLDCDSNIEKAAKVKIVDLEGNVVGEFINDFEEGSYSINVTTSSMTLKARVFESTDSKENIPGYTFDYGLNSNDGKEINGNIRVYISSEDESKIQIRSNLKYKEKNGAKTLKLKGNVSEIIFLLEQDGSFIELLESGENENELTTFRYVEKENYGCELVSKKVYPCATCIPVIETSYTTRILPLDFPENARDAWRHSIKKGNILKKHHTLTRGYQVVNDHRGNIFDVMNYASQKNRDFLDRIKEAGETLTIGDIHIFENLMSIACHDLTPEERIAFFGSNYCKRKDTPIFSERGDLVLPGHRGKGSREHN